MARCFETWTVLPHKPIEKISDNLWSVEGMMPNGKTQRRMVIARLRDGRVVVHNGIALDDAEMREVDAFGNVAAIVVPNAFHRQDALIWKQRYPAARVFCPRGATKKVLQVVAVDGDYSTAPADDTVRLVHLEGMKDLEGVLEVKSADGATLVFNDAILNMPKLGGVVGLLLGPTGRPSVPRFARFMMVKDKSAFSSHVARLAETQELRRVIVGHGRTITSDAGAMLKSVAREVGG